MRRMLAVMAAAAALCVGAGAAEGARVFVYIFDFDFSANPPEGPIVDPTINVGDTVVWIVVDEFHTTTACLGQAEYWDSGTLYANDSYDHTFTIPGVYNYYCIPHGHDNGDGTASGMSGSITVAPAPGAAGVLGLGLAVMGGWRRRR